MSIFDRLKRSVNDAVNSNATKKDTLTTLTSFEKISLRVISMRYDIEYEILNKPPKAVLSLYHIFYKDGSNKRVIEKSAVTDTEIMLELFNSCKIIRWNGFRGNHPKDVSDGVMFKFQAEVNEGQTVYAEGSENFPKGYREFVSRLNLILKNDGLNSSI